MKKGRFKKKTLREEHFKRQMGNGDSTLCCDDTRECCNVTDSLIAPGDNEAPIVPRTESDMIKQSEFTNHYEDNLMLSNSTDHDVTCVMQDNMIIMPRKASPDSNIGKRGLYNDPGTGMGRERLALGRGPPNARSTTRLMGIRSDPFAYTPMGSTDAEATLLLPQLPILCPDTNPKP